jgi:hypothetical protein
MKVDFTLDEADLLMTFLVDYFDEFKKHADTFDEYADDDLWAIQEKIESAYFEAVAKRGKTSLA